MEDEAADPVETLIGEIEGLKKQVEDLKQQASESGLDQKGGLDPRSYPNDERIAQWTRRHGATGVKTYVLDGHPQNTGCVAVYRELSMRERGMLARLEEVEEKHPGAFDYMKMLVSSALLYPTLETYPHPPFAASELFNRIRQHGHGPLPEEEMSPEEAATQLPEHMIGDIKAARRVAKKSFEDGRYASLYADLIVQLATGPEGTLDIGVFNELWGLSPGRLRDLAGRVERARMDLREAQFKVLEEEIEDPEKRQRQAEEIDRRLPSPFQDIDEATEGDTIPDGHGPTGPAEEVAEEETPVGAYEEAGSEELPPDTPSREETIEDLREAKREKRPSDPIPPNT